MYLIHVHGHQNSGRPSSTLTPLASLNMGLDTQVEHIMAEFLLSSAKINTMAIVILNLHGMPSVSIHRARGSIPAKVGFWVGLRIFSYVPTPTKLTNAISKTQLSGTKKRVFSPKTPRKCPLFSFWRFLAVFSGFKPAE